MENGLEQALQPQQGGQQAQGQAPAIDEAKINSIIDNRTKSIEANVLKQYFKDQGLTEEEIGQAIQSYKQSRVQKQNEAKQAQDQANQELEELRAYKCNNEITSASRKVAKEMGISDDRVDAIIKLADKSAYMENGKLSENAIKTSFEKALEAYPFLKAETQQRSQSNNGFQVVGADMSKGTQDNGFNFNFTGVRAKK